VVVGGNKRGTGTRWTCRLKNVSNALAQTVGCRLDAKNEIVIHRSRLKGERNQGDLVKKLEAINGLAQVGQTPTGG